MPVYASGGEALLCRMTKIALRHGLALPDIEQVIHSRLEEVQRAEKGAAVNTLISLNEQDTRFPVNGRELHQKLEVATQYKDWFPRMCEYGFYDGIDYCSKLSNRSDGLPGKPRTDHYLTLGMAKELCMLQRTDKGREVRRYLISVEEQWNSPEAVMSRALQMANNKLTELSGKVLHLEAANSLLTVQMQAAKPKADYFDELVDRGVNISLRETAKQLGVKERAFVEFLIKHKYLYRDKKGKLMPYAQHDNDLFVIKECFNEKTNWGGTQTLTTPKGRETFRLLMEGMRNN